MFKQRMTTSLTVLVAAGLLAALRAPAETATTNAAALAKPASKLSDLFPDTVVAKGKGVEVKRTQLDDELVSIKASAAARGQSIPPEQMTMLERRVLDQMIGIQLVLSKATDADKAKGKELADKHFEEARTNAPSEEAFNRQLKAIGISADELRRKMAEEAVAETVVERELKTTPTAEEIKKYYDEHPARFESPERVRAAHILLATRDMATGTELSEEKKAAKRKQAEDLVKRARKGEDFAQLAKEYSEDPGSKDKGGEYTFPKGQMVAEFEAAAFGLNTNEVSDVVTTQFGYHVIKLYEKLPARKEPFSGADTKTVVPKRDGQMVTLGELLTQQTMRAQLPDYMEKLKKSANVEILDEKLRNAQEPALPSGIQPLKPDTKPAAKPNSK
jgi:parvulin-like peptidyl-prolyl isomerase